MSLVDGQQKLQTEVGELISYLSTILALLKVTKARPQGLVHLKKKKKRPTFALAPCEIHMDQCVGDRQYGEKVAMTSIFPIEK